MESTLSFKSQGLLKLMTMEAVTVSFKTIW